MNENISTQPKNTAPVIPVQPAHKDSKNLEYHFVRRVGHDARQDWLLILYVSAGGVIVLLIFSIWMYFRVYSEKAFTFENENAVVPTISINMESLAKTIELYEQRRLKFNTIRLNGVEAYDPSL